jgi:predicted phosphate transport protein (TIGR00153 family)
MRIPFFSRDTSQPFDGVTDYIEKIKQCAWSFQQAVECYLSENCDTFEIHRKEFVILQSDTDAVKQEILKSLPHDHLMPVNRFQLLLHINQQDKILAAIAEALRWITYLVPPGIPEQATKEVYLLIDAVIEPIEELVQVNAAVGKFLRKSSDKQTKKIEKAVNELRLKEIEADKAEDLLKLKLFSLKLDPTTLYHAVTFADLTGKIADRAKESGDIVQFIVSGLGRG